LKISLKQLETLVWVADLGSFRKAAERLNTTQPNISSRVASLETALGVVLMERDAGSVRLTTQGRELVNRARVVLNSVDAFIEAVDEPELFDGILRLGVTEMVVHSWLRDFLKKFKRSYPNMAIELTVDLSVNLDQELADRSIDIAFHSGPFVRSITGTQDLGTYPIIWVASPSLGITETRKLAIDELAKYTILTHARNTQPYAQVVAHFSEGLGHKARLVPSSNLSACLQMTIDGYGVAALLAPMVKAPLQSKQLIQLDYQWVPDSLKFAARYEVERSSRFVAQAAKMASEIGKQHAATY